jgi:general secretion pathway protein D
LPVVGPLFGTRTTDLRRTELLILLRPRIVQTPQDARDMTNELRSKMQGLLPVVHREPNQGNRTVAPNQGAGTAAPIQGTGTRPTPQAPEPLAQPRAPDPWLPSRAPYP